MKNETTSSARKRSVKLPDAVETSPVVTLMDIVWNNVNRDTGRSHSWRVINESMRHAIELAIASGMRFEPNDVITVGKNYNGGHWLAAESLYSRAVECSHGTNRTACVALEKAMNRPPMLWKLESAAGERLCIGSKLRCLGDGYEWHVTSFRHDGLNLTRYDSIQDRTVAGRRKWTYEENDAQQKKWASYHRQKLMSVAGIISIDLQREPDHEVSLPGSSAGEPLVVQVYSGLFDQPRFGQARGFLALMDDLSAHGETREQALHNVLAKRNNDKWQSSVTSRYEKIVTAETLPPEIAQLRLTRELSLSTGNCEIGMNAWIRRMGFSRRKFIRIGDIPWHERRGNRELIRVMVKAVMNPQPQETKTV